jgi:hypothetical protein
MRAEAVQPWRPRTCDKSQWPPDYPAVYAWRLKQTLLIRDNPTLLAAAKAYYSTRPAEFIMDWMDTYNPRKGDAKWMPFVFFTRQSEFIDFVHEMRNTGQNGLVEKCRDAGATWLSCAYSVWAWLFIPNDSIGWGSRKQDLVDKMGDPDSIFEKMRLILRRMPAFWKPKGFVEKNHCAYLKFINPENGSTITGEAGDNIGRGGRKSMFFKDESAHYERAERIEAALGDNTNVQIDISSVNGLGNAFHRRREAGKDWFSAHTHPPGYTRVFVIDWQDHPEKTREWYDLRKAKYEREAMSHIFAQEVDRNYSAAITNTIIPFEWIEACVDAHLHIPALRIPPPNIWMAGLDIADEGLDLNALAVRQWVILRQCETWGERDAGATTRRAANMTRPHWPLDIQYDCIGMGSTVKAEYNRLVDDYVISPSDCRMIPWHAGATVVSPYENILPDDEKSALNRDFFGNMKAQAWWAMRTRCYKTYRARMHNDVYPADELFSIDSSIENRHQLMKELAQPTKADSSGLRMIVNKMPKGAKSPNMADAVIMCYFPAPEDSSNVLTGSYHG